MLKSLPASYVVVKGRNPNHQLIMLKCKSHASNLVILADPSNFIRFGTAPKKYQNAGLRVKTKTKAHPAPREDGIESALGGLDDEDAEAERPAMSPVPVKRSGTSRLEFPVHLQRDKARTNEVSF